MHKADNLPPSCAVVKKSGNFNFLEPFWPVQACNGNALPFTVDCLTTSSVNSIENGHSSETDSWLRVEEIPLVF